MWLLIGAVVVVFLLVGYAGKRWETDTHKAQAGLGESRAAFSWLAKGKAVSR